MLSPNGPLWLIPFILPILPIPGKGLEAPKNSAKISSAFRGLNLDEFVANPLLEKPCVPPLELGDEKFAFNPSSP
jgi:hypothetical protein